MKKTKKILLLLFFTFLISFLLEFLLPAWSVAFASIHSILIAILCYEWCRNHAEENAIEPWAGSKILCALLPPVGIPYYLFSGFGFKNGGVKLFGAILYVAILILILGLLVYVLPPNS